MKPITNILLVLALICYVFLPFYHVAILGSVSGFRFTAGTITQHASLDNTLFALTPFIAGFLAMGCNALKNRWWALLAAAFIVMGIIFFAHNGHVHDIALQHQPEVLPSEDIGEGFDVTGMGIGYKLSYLFMVLALISALLSLLPFKFNETIERAVDDTIDRSIEDMRAIGTRIRHQKADKATTEAPKDEAPTTAPDEPATTPPPLPIDKEDPSRFMPK